MDVGPVKYIAIADEVAFVKSFAEVLFNAGSCFEDNGGDIFTVFIA
jgi:hypothetical protein